LAHLTAICRSDAQGIASARISNWRSFSNWDERSHTAVDTTRFEPVPRCRDPFRQCRGDQTVSSNLSKHANGEYLHLPPQSVLPRWRTASKKTLAALARQACVRFCSDRQHASEATGSISSLSILLELLRNPIGSVLILNPRRSRDITITIKSRANIGRTPHAQALIPKAIK
jgi:hypothetical protein